MSASLILGSTFTETFSRLGIDATDWAKISRKASRAVPDEIIEDDEAVAEFEKKYILDWISSLEASVKVETSKVVDATEVVEASTEAETSKVETTPIDVASVIDSATVIQESSPEMPKPKRGSNSYIHYLKASRLQFTIDHPDIKGKGIVSALASQWKTLTDEQKSEFVELARLDKLRYEEEMLTYIAPLNATPPKKKKSKNKSKKNTSTNQCCSRKWSRDGMKQCKSKCVNDESAFCSTCQKCADDWDGAVGPDLWKKCYDEGKGRPDTKTGKRNNALWFGTMKQFEGETTYPASSFMTEDGQRVVVLAYPDNEFHSTAEQFHIDEGAILGHSSLSENWSKNWHALGRKAKADASTEKKSKKAKKISIKKSKDEAQSLTPIEDLFAADEVAETSVPSSIVVAAFDSQHYQVNHNSMEVVDDDMDIMGNWIMDGAPDKPDTLPEIAKWLSNYGHPDDSAEIGEESDDE